MKKLMGLFLVFIMVFSLSACGNSGTSSSTTSGSTASAVDDAEVLTEITLPLSSEKEELSVWLVWSNEKTADPNALEGVQYLEELTNVHINWITVTAAEAGDRFQLLQTSSDLPDIILPVPNNGSSTIDDAIADGWAMDMTNLIAKYMPNYRAYLESHETDRKYIAANDGTVKCAANVAGDDNGYRGELQWAGLAVRTDLIEKAGYTGPLETIDDYHQMLLTCKQNLDGLTAPLYVGPNGYGINGAFLSAYGVTNSIMQLDGKVAYGPVQAGYGQWLEEMRTWFSEGLIDPNFDTVGGLDVYRAPASVVGTNQSVCFTTIYSCVGTLMPMVQGIIADPTAVITGVVNPVLNAGDEPMLINVGTGSGGGTTTGNIYISADCKNPELAAKWLDFMLTEQAMVAGQYGKEGVQYTLDTAADAPFKYVYNEGYQTEEERVTKLGTPGVGYYNWSTGAQSSAAQMEGLVATYAAQGLEFSDTYQDLLDTKELWDGQGYIDNLLNIVPTGDEAAAVATIKADIETRVAEYTVQYIKGQTDESFADFCQELENMQLQSLLDAYQVALERFNSK
jgi:putative aldouronate transport system substrate-binding protein